MDIDNGMYVNRLEGMAEGEINAKLDMARKMKAEKIDINTIARVSGLSEDEIKKL